MIIGEKLSYSEPNQKFIFDDLYLAKMMIQSDVTFYQQDANQKVIDYQFVTTKKFFQTLMYIYIFFFMIPLIIIIFSDNAELNMYCYEVAYFTQIGFFLYEILQMRAQGWSYLQGYNISDVLQFVIFFSLMFVQELWPNDATESIA
jgi:hypothetical protein